MSQTKPNDHMTTVVCHGPEDCRVEQVARPNPGARGLTGAYGCDMYTEAAGVVQGLNPIRKPGRFVEFPVLGADTTADWSILGERRELEVRGSHLGPCCDPIAIEERDEAIRVASSLDPIKVLLGTVA